MGIDKLIEDANLINSSLQDSIGQSNISNKEIGLLRLLKLKLISELIKEGK
jgi:hypothetical protein